MSKNCLGVPHERQTHDSLYLSFHTQRILTQILFTVLLEVDVLILLYQRKRGKILS